jgi:hypothetical protein
MSWLLVVHTQQRSLSKSSTENIPWVTTEVVMGVLDNLARQKAKVASVTECAWDNPVTYW